MPNIGDPVTLRSDGRVGRVVTKDINVGARQYSASGVYGSIPYTEYGVSVSRLGIDQDVMDGDFGGELKRIPTVKFDGAVYSVINDNTVPWPPMSW